MVKGVNGRILVAVVNNPAKEGGYLLQEVTPEGNLGEKFVLGISGSVPVMGSRSADIPAFQISSLEEVKTVINFCDQLTLIAGKEPEKGKDEEAK